MEKGKEKKTPVQLLLNAEYLDKLDKLLKKYGLQHRTTLLRMLIWESFESTFEKKGE